MDNQVMVNPTTGEMTEATTPMASWEGAAQRALEAKIERDRIVKDILVEGVDYGTSVGTNKAALWKAGAEKVCDAFAVYPVYSLQRLVEDFDRPLFHYAYLCELKTRGTNIVVATALASCNSMEKKYSMKSDGSPQPLEYTYSIVNTIDKMSQKRSHVGASLNFGFSQYFTQDPEMLGDKTPKPSVQQPQPTSGAPAPADPGQQQPPPAEDQQAAPEGQQDAPWQDPPVTELQVKRVWGIAFTAANATGQKAPALVNALLDEYGIKDPSELHKGEQYEGFCEKLEAAGK